MHASLIKTIALLLAVIAGLICFQIFSVPPAVIPTLATPASNQQMRCIIIDAGHGGLDGGAVAADGTEEADLNLAIALKLQQILEFSGFKVIMTRTSEQALVAENESASIRSQKVADMKARLALINQYPDALFVSVHMNAFEGSNHGAQVFYSPNHENGKLLANLIQTNIVSLLDTNNHRVEKESQEEIYLLKNAQIPAVIVECGFISNQDDLANLKDEDYQMKMAYTIFAGILQYTLES